MNSLYDYLVKIIIIGNSDVGKTSLLSVYNDNNFYSVPTIGVEFLSKYIKFNRTVYKLHIWDTAGQERYKTIVNIYYKNAHVVIYAFDLTDKKSFDNLPSWIKDVHAILSTNYIGIIVGNKSDIKNRKVSYEDASQFASSNNMYYIETSARDNINIDKLFNTILQGIELNPEIIKQDDIDSVYLQPKAPTKSRCC